MKPGQYILSRDVQNPRPDRRARYDWRLQETWRRGQEFTIDEDRALNRMTRIRLTWGRWDSQCLYIEAVETRTQVDALLDGLVPAERSGSRDLKALFSSRHEGDGSGFAVLAKLLDTRVIDVTQIEAALNMIDADFDEAEKERAASGQA